MSTLLAELSQFTGTEHYSPAPSLLENRAH